jgi:hypothetical protein
MVLPNVQSFFGWLDSLVEQVAVAVSFPALFLQNSAFFASYHQIVVSAVLFHQGIMVSIFDYCAIVYDHDSVGMAYC